MHIDMDAFYASIEQLDHPEWRGKPVIVGGTSDRGVVSAASYEARKFGVRSAIPIFQARRLCPQGIFTRGRMGRYAEVSRQIMAVLGNFSPVVEKASIDEAYLDASGLERLFGPVDELGRKIKQAVKEESGLTCSIGAAPVKFLAKIASDLNKPDGLSIIYPEKMQEFLLRLPLEKIPGLGKQTLKKISSYGMRTAGDAQQYGQEFWVQRFGKAGQAIFERCRGIDLREVEPYTPPKSESAENTFERDISDIEELKTWLLRQAERVGTSLRRSGIAGRTITLKVKYADFTQLTRSHSLPEPVNSTRIIYEVGSRLLDDLKLSGPLRLIGLGVSNFDNGADEDAPGGVYAHNPAYNPAYKSGHMPASPGSMHATMPGAMPGTATSGIAPKPVPRSVPRPVARPAEQALLPGLTAKKEADPLLPPQVDSQKEKALDDALDKARSRFGAGVIVRGRLFEQKDKD